MNCPYCDKFIPGMTGLMELRNFKKHLRTCKKNPDRKMVLDKKGTLKEVPRAPDLLGALDIRHESGQ